MSIQNIDRTLTETIEEYQRRVREAYVMSDEFALRPDEMEALVVANARAFGARLAQGTIREIVSFSGIGGELSKQAEMNALPRIIRGIEGNMDSLLRNKHTHIASLGLLYDVQKALTLEMYV